jgi:inhibitor of cysteine peptidase
MKKMIMIVLAGLMILALAAGCSGKTTKLDSEMNGQTITVKTGETIELKLAGNPTTGFDWIVQNLDTTILSQSGEYSYKSDSNLVGSGGVMTFKFKAEAAGTTTLTLYYMRAWEKDVEPAQVYSVTVIVE